MFEELLSRLDGPLGCVFTVDGGQPISQKKRMFTRSQCYFVNARRLSGRESITKDGPTDGIICCVNTSAKFVLLMLSLVHSAVEGVQCYVCSWSPADSSKYFLFSFTTSRRVYRDANERLICY